MFKGAAFSWAYNRPFTYAADFMENQAKWIIYRTAEFDANSLPWSPGAEPLPLGAANIERLIAMVDRFLITHPGFKPKFTEFTNLDREWRGHVPGCRVLVTPSDVAIENQVK